MRNRQEIEQKIKTGFNCLRDASYDALESKGMAMALNSRDVAYFYGAVQYLHNFLEETLSGEKVCGLSDEQKQFLTGVQIGGYWDSYQEGVEEAKKWLEGADILNWIENFHYHL